MTREEILKVKDTRVHKVSNSIGVYSIYKEIRKNKWFDIGRPLTEHQFYSIIRTINKELAKLLIQGEDIKLPCRMGTLELRKRKTAITFENGKLKTTLPVDWDRTLKLWCDDEEAYKERTLIKAQEQEVFKVHYSKARANYINKSFYQFNINREIKKALKHNIKEGKVDAFLLIK